jgi:O-antigen ligase
MFAYLILLSLIFTPLYAVRFSIGNIPTNFLMMWVFFVWAVWIATILAQNRIKEFINFLITIDKQIVIFVSLFFLSGLISLFVNGIDRSKLGQFIVLFLQPISMFLIAGFVFKQNPKGKNLLLVTCYFLLAFAGAYAIVQYFTLVGLPHAWWGNSVEPKRALAFYSHPNFYALWSAPLLALLIADLGFKIKDLRKNWQFITAWVLGAVGLLLSFSRAGWLGLAAAVGVYLIVAADNKIRMMTFGAIIVIIIVIVSVPNLRYRLLLPFYGEKSSVSRLSLWETGIKGIKESPVFGLGLTGFSEQWITLNTDPGLTETHNLPHNIFLDLWVETGFLGLISFIGIASLYIYRGLRPKSVILNPNVTEGEESQKEMIRSTQHDVVWLGIALFLIALITQGQIDNPYFKNDLAMIFWMVLALV